MKRTEKEFKKYVQQLRKMMPYYNNDRRVVVVAEGTKQAEQIIAKARIKEGTTLYHIYTKWSQEKQSAFDDAFDMYCCSRHGENFHICSHNTYGFCVSWLHDDGLTLLTPNTEYLVVFNE